MTHLSDDRLAMCEKKTLRRIFELVYGNYLGWRLRQNEELCELLDRPDIVKCIMFKSLQWTRLIVQMDNMRIQKKSKGRMESFMEEDL
jgi:hypothetical protein